MYIYIYLKKISVYILIIIYIYINIYIYYTHILHAHVVPFLSFYIGILTCLMYEDFISRTQALFFALDKHNTGLLMNLRNIFHQYTNKYILLFVTVSYFLANFFLFYMWYIRLSTP